MLTVGNDPVIGAVSGSCPDTAVPCDDATDLTCDNGGLCCEKIFDKSKFCACPQGYVGSTCDVKDIFEVLESRDNTMRVIGVTSGVSVAIGLIALIAIGTVTFLIIKSSRRRRYMEPVDPERDLDKKIGFVQEELSRLSTIQQLNKLHRLSKLFEKTVREAILSEPGQRVERPKSVAMNDYLPRWSSAPSYINRPPDDLDEVDVFLKTKLQPVFSLQ